MAQTATAQDAFENWRRALRGERQPVYESEPWIGYFAVQDRGPNAKPEKGGRWPKVACAIFHQGGKLIAERAGEVVPMEWVWPWAASRPITYEAYQFWHHNRRWPEDAS